MKKINLSYFVILFFVTMMFSCSKNASEDIDNEDEIELLIKKIENDKKNSVNNPDNNPGNNLAAAVPGGGGNYTCYNATLSYDYDCDGQLEASNNVLTASWSCCWSQVLDMTIEAQQNGWCYKYSAKSQCRTFSCQAPPDCGGDDEGGF